MSRFTKVQNRDPLLLGISLMLFAIGGFLITLFDYSIPLSGFTVFLMVLFTVALWLGMRALCNWHSINPTHMKLVNLVILSSFGFWVLALWEMLTVGLEVPSVLLPPPSSIWQQTIGSLQILALDFHQTFIKSVLTGYAMGCGAGFLIALLVDRSPFLRRGILPLGNMVSALPIVGIAPIMVMWFGFDWQSKAAVVVTMTFFPMLVNTVTGLASSGRYENELLDTYATGYWKRLIYLRLPNSLPFIFNALKINTTLSLIGAIVAEFFGTPIVGMGFRISTEIGRMNLSMVWAEILVAAIAGSLFYASVDWIERKVTFWHPSVRGGR